MNKMTSKIAAPYARAMFDFSVQENLMHQVTADFVNLDTFLSKESEFTNYLYNPVVKRPAKRQIINKILKPQINQVTLNFLLILVDRNRINYLQPILTNYLNLVYEAAAIKRIEVSTAVEFTAEQTNRLIDKLKNLTKAREIQLAINVDPNLIGGFLIKTNSKVLDFTIQNQLKQLAKHLDVSIEI